MKNEIKGKSFNEVMDVNAKSMPKQAGAKLRSIEIEPADNGGHVVTHRFESANGPYMEPKTHVFGAKEGGKAMAHIAEHMGIKTEKKGEGENEEISAAD